MRSAVGVATLLVPIMVSSAAWAVEDVPKLKESALKLQELLRSVDANKSPGEWEILTPMWLCTEGIMQENWQKAADADAYLRARLARREWFDRLGPLCRIWGKDLLRAAAAEEKLDLHAAVARMIALVEVMPWDQRANMGIEQHRKGQANIRVVTQDDQPVAGATVKTTQETHDFLFGCAFPNWRSFMQRVGPEGWKKFEGYFKSLFNYATSENMFKWREMQPTNAPPSYADIDAWVAWCEANGIAAKGHCLVWGNQGQQGVPQFLEALPKDQVRQRVEERVRTTVSKYAGRVNYWDVVNEPLHCHWFEQHLDPNYIALSLQWAREANPNAVLVVNEFGNFNPGGAERFRDLIENLRDQNAPVDAAGLQTHDNGVFYPPQLVFDTLDTVAQAGVALHLTEITFSSDGRPIRGGFREGTWTPEVQGQFYEYLYTLAFGHPAVQAITMWALWDGSSWLPQGGIIAADWTPKPAYENLNRLINQTWRSNLELKTGGTGWTAFRGFYGKYNIEVTTPDGRKATAEFHLRKGADNTLIIRL